MDEVSQQFMEEQDPMPASEAKPAFDSRDTRPGFAMPFQPGSGLWEGVVIVVRPPNADDRSLCRVASARTTELNGKRAIAPFDVPYSMVKKYYTVEDGAEAYVYGEFFARPNADGHFEFYEKASQKEFFLTAGGAKRLYPSANRVV